MRTKTVDRLLTTMPKETAIFVDLYADLVVRINQLLREKGISKKELAEKLDKKPSEISKWLNGEHNFTLRSLARLSAELDAPLLMVPERREQTEFITLFNHSFQAFVVHKNTKNTPVDQHITWQTAHLQHTQENVG